LSSAPLPPLPPAGATADSEFRPGGSSMIDLLNDDHHRLGQLCDRLAAGPDARVEEVLVAMLSRHLSSEEQYLYPTVRKVLPDGGDLADHEVKADADMLRALQDLHTTSRDDDRYASKIDALKSQVLQHTTRTGGELFPRLATECSDEDLIRLGNRVQIAQESAPTRPHVSTPFTPPLNKVVEPAVGVVDKVRDALTRRTTWPQDL
jgi:hemerythrin superfamily protein